MPAAVDAAILIDARAAIGRRYGLDPARIICGCGSDELLNLLIRAYCGPGDELLYSQYGFLMYPINALGVGATPVAAPENNYRTDIDAMIAKITDTMTNTIDRNSTDSARPRHNTDVMLMPRLRPSQHPIRPCRRRGH